MLLVIASKRDAKVRVVSLGRRHGGKGRRPTPECNGGTLRSGRVTRCYLAVDVGGTKLAAGVVDESGRILVRDRLLTPPRDVWPTLSRLILRVVAAAPTELVGCGVGCGGPIDPSTRTVSPLYIPSWTRFPLVSELEELLQLPVAVDTDARALALAEAWCGGAVGVSDFIGVVMGTGIGGGSSAGQLLQGRVGNAGYIGHVVVEPDGCVHLRGQGLPGGVLRGRAIEAETGRPRNAPRRHRRAHRSDGRSCARLRRRSAI